MLTSSSCIKNSLMFLLQDVKARRDLQEIVWVSQSKEVQENQDLPALMASLDHEVKALSLLWNLSKQSAV